MRPLKVAIAVAKSAKMIPTTTAEPAAELAQLFTMLRTYLSSALGCCQYTYATKSTARVWVVGQYI